MLDANPKSGNDKDQPLALNISSEFCPHEISAYITLLVTCWSLRLFDPTPNSRDFPTNRLTVRFTVANVATLTCGSVVALGGTVKREVGARS